MTMDRGNINYPASSSLAFAAAGKILDNPRYSARGREFAHASLGYFTKNKFLFGEGKPLHVITPKGARPIDLGYNVEESLPSLALYGLMTGDQEVVECVVAALRTHAEFMLPDGGWDNSWGSRSYKWTWWGSRTSDGCHPAYALLAKYDPGFREIAWRNLEQLAACTHAGLLYGGPHSFVHGEKACVHHAFTHAKALAAVLDHGGAAKPEPRVEIPREKAIELKSYSEAGVELVAIGPWMATVTEYDFEYHGGQASGGALSLLYHKRLGPLLAASMTEYHLVEPQNQQTHGNYPCMCLTPRIEHRADGKTYTSLSDLQARLGTAKNGKAVQVTAEGIMQTVKHEPPANGGARYRLTYRFAPESVKLTASLIDGSPEDGKFIVPVISSRDENFEMDGQQSVRVKKPHGVLTVSTDAAEGFDGAVKTRVFNLVPGFECLPFTVTLPRSGKSVSIELACQLQA